MIVFYNGQFVDETDICISVKDGAFLTGYGVYETLRTYNGTLIFINEHLDRLFKSMETLLLFLPYSKKEISDFVHELVKRTYTNLEQNDLRIRITLTSGNDSFREGKISTYNFLITATPILVDKLSPVSMVTFKCERILPSVKSVSMLPNILAKQNAIKNNVYESILVNRYGNVTEGTFTNLFFVKDGILFTPSDDILFGITRSVVLDLASNIMLIEQIVVSKEELLTADEVFITNSTFGIIPVDKIDNIPFSSHQFTAQLSNLYFSKVFK